MRIILAIFVLLIAFPATAGPVTLRTTDGLRLKADWMAPANKKKGVMVALHMFQNDRHAWRSLMMTAKKKGLGMLAVDLRGHGESKRHKNNDLSKRVVARDPALFMAMHKDVDAALKFLKRKRIHPSRVVLVGASVGCSVALHYAATHPKIRAGVLLSPGTNYLGIPSLQHITQWGNRPLLMVAPVDEVEKGARPLFSAMLDRTHSIVLAVPQEKVHGTHMFGKVPRLEMRLVEWVQLRVDEALKKATKPKSKKRPTQRK